MIFRNLNETITLFQYFNIGFFLLIFTYALITINKQKVIFYILVFFLLSEVITIFKYSIIDEISVLPNSNRRKDWIFKILKKNYTYQCKYNWEKYYN